MITHLTRTQGMEACSPPSGNHLHTIMNIMQERPILCTYLTSECSGGS